jgi:hypothetical protein
MSVPAVGHVHRFEPVIYRGSSGFEQITGYACACGTRSWSRYGHDAIADPLANVRAAAAYMRHHYSASPWTPYRRRATTRRMRPRVRQAREWLARKAAPWL